MSFTGFISFFLSRGGKISETSAVVSISLLQIFTLYDILAVAKVIFHVPTPHKVYFIATVILIVGLNIIRYENTLKLQALNKRWEDEDLKNKDRNGNMIILYLSASLGIMVLYLLFE